MRASLPVSAQLMVAPWLAQRLRNVAEQLTVYSTGRGLTFSDRDAIDQIVAAACLCQREKCPATTEIQRVVMGLERFYDRPQTAQTLTDFVEKHINADDSGANT